MTLLYGVAINYTGKAMFKRYVFVEGLTNLLGSNGKYLINCKGQIKDIDGNDITYRRDDAGNKIVRCLGWDGEKDYRVIDLVAIQFKSLYIPKNRFDEIVAFLIDGNPDNTHASNIGYRFKNGKIEVDGMLGFYYVPSMTSIAINEKGEIINSEKRTLYKPSVSPSIKRKNIKGGYRYITGHFSRGELTRFTRHRAMCLTFKDYPDNVDSLTVNHIDGIPGNDSLENLEWATRGQNNLHAFKSDLKKQHMKVLSRDALTGKVTEYYSISECSRQLGYATEETIRHRLFKCAFGAVFQDGRQFKLKSDTRDWVIPNDPEKEIEVSKEKLEKSLLVRNCKTLEEFKSDSIEDASRKTGINSSSIQLRVKNNDKRPLFGFQFKNVKDIEPWPSFTKKEYLESLKANSFKVDARNLLSGETLQFPSLREASIYFGSSAPRNAAAKGEQAVMSNGWQTKLSHEEWEEVPDLDEYLYRKTKEVMGREEKTGNVILASSTVQLAELLGINAQSVRLAAYTRGNKVYAGYRFRLGITSEPWPDTKV